MPNLMKDTLIPSSPCVSAQRFLRCHLQHPEKIVRVLKISRQASRRKLVAVIQNEVVITTLANHLLCSPGYIWPANGRLAFAGYIYGVSLCHAIKKFPWIFFHNDAIVRKRTY